MQECMHHTQVTLYWHTSEVNKEEKFTGWGQTAQAHSHVLQYININLSRELKKHGPAHIGSRNLTKLCSWAYKIMIVMFRKKWSWGNLKCHTMTKQQTLRKFAHQVPVIRTANSHWLQWRISLTHSMLSARRDGILKKFPSPLKIKKVLPKEEDVYNDLNGSNSFGYCLLIPGLKHVHVCHCYQFTWRSFFAWDK